MNLCTWVHRPLFLLLLTLTFATSSQLANAAKPLSWHETPGKYTELRQGDRPILRYMHLTHDFSTEQSRYETKKVFHHIFSPAGDQLLTNGPTGDEPYSKEIKYPHHRGLYYGFNKISFGDDKQADTWHCGKGESQQHVEVLSQEVGTDFGRHRLAINWHDRDGKVFVREQREVTATLHKEGTMIDFVSTLESATGDTIHLDGDPQHAGVQFRAIGEVAASTADQTYYIRTDGKGKLGETRNWNHKAEDPMNEQCTNRPWNAMSFVAGGKRYTAVYLDHPENPKPARYSERDYGRFGSYFVHDLKPDQPLTVRYRLWILEGETTQENCADLAEAFVGNGASASDNTPPEGFVALFNGRDLTGWQGLVGNPKTRASETSDEKRAQAQAAADELMRKHWSVQDGALVYDSAKDGASLCTIEDYADFELYLDWKIQPAGDSGIYLRGSPQVQIWDADHQPFFHMGADKGSGALWNNKENERFPLVKADNPAGQWNTFYIKMVGEKVTVKLNDKLVVDNVTLENYWERDKPLYPTGPIELQKHDGVLWFKNIYLREIQ